MGRVYAKINSLFKFSFAINVNNLIKIQKNFIKTVKFAYAERKRIQIVSISVRNTYLNHNLALY